MKKLKVVLQEEIDKVVHRLINSGNKDSGTLKEWLQSLQRIDKLCEERNRY